jgi:hypothetical protein
MQYFNFKRIIEKYSRSFKVTVVSEGEYNDAGDYVKGKPTEYELYGAIIGYAQSKIYRSEGTLKQQDKALHMLEPIDNALIGATVLFEDEEYRIEAQKGKGNAVFTGVYSYTLRYVSAFKEGGSDD